MQTQSLKSAGLEFPVQVPATVEEFNAMGGDCLKEAINNVLYRSYLANFRSRFTERLSTLTGIERKTKPGNKKKDGTFGDDQWDESEVKFVDRVLAETGKEITDFADLVEEVQAGGYTPEGEKTPLDPLVFDPKASEGGSAGPKVPAKTYLNAAQQVMDAGNANVVATNLSKILGREVTTEKESIAAGIRDAENLEKKSLSSKYVG